jgi:archaellum biogenesis ATPase FlaH
MISGDPGVGKTMLTLKLAELSLSRGKRCIFVACDQPPANTRKIVSEMEHSVSRISEAISTNARSFIMVDAVSSAGKLKSEELYHTTGIFDLNEMSHVVADASDSSTFDPDLGLTLVIDSVNPLFLHRDATTVLKFLDHCRTKCVGRGDAFLLSVTEGAIDQSLCKKLESMSDVVIEMKFVEETHGRRRRFRVTKIRGRNLIDEWVYFDIVSKDGMVVRPIEKPGIPA